MGARDALQADDHKTSQYSITDDDARSARSKRQHQALDDQLPRDLRPPRADRGPRRKLLGAQVRSGQRDIGQVNRPDQQDERGASPEEIERGSNAANEDLLEQFDLRVEACVDQELFELRKSL